MANATLLTRDLRTALSAGELAIAYQPQFDLVSGGTDAAPAAVAVEALCRWTHAEMGEIPPDRFIPLAERGAFLENLDEHVFARAAAQVVRWRDAGIEVGLAANASPAHFSLRFADMVLADIDLAGLDPASVTIEITEAPAPQLRPPMRAAMERLRAAGVAMSVDDFDGVITTAGLLDTLPIDEVKIDRALTQRTDARADDSIAEVVELATRRGWRTVAEGIETEADLTRSRARGCQRGQGYLWGAPMVPGQIEPLLSAH